MNKLPIAVGEGRVYGFNDAAQPHTIFNQEAKVSKIWYVRLTKVMKTRVGPNTFLAGYRISG